MQTNFTPEQLEDPQVAASEKILRSCVHCGFCTATCPTYVLLGDELDSPRGRIYLIKDMLEGDKPASKEVVTHIDRCLSCLACMTTCPSGVHYMHLVDHARAHIEKTYKRPWHDRATRAVLAAILPYPRRFRAALAASLLGRLTLPLLRRMPGLERFAAMLALAPKHLPPQAAQAGPAVYPAEGPRKGRVALLVGCAQAVLAPEINAATIRLLNRNGIEVVLAGGEGCCGALVHHMGKEEGALAFARANIDAWTAEIEGAGLDAILMTASGCGTTVKDYGFMLRTDASYAGRAQQVSDLTLDITEYLVRIGLPPAAYRSDWLVAYHSACSMQHGQGITAEPRALLTDAGFLVHDIPEGHICCGSAGTYNILQPQLAEQLKARKAANIERVAPDVVATGNIGCITQIAGATDVPLVHTVELLDWAHGGPMPAALADRQPQRRVAAGPARQETHGGAI